MIALVTKLQRALLRYGVGDLAGARHGAAAAATPAQLLQALHDLELNGITFAPLSLTEPMHRAAVAAGKAAQARGDDGLEAAWATLTAHALPELRRLDALRREAGTRALDAAERMMA